MPDGTPIRVRRAHAGDLETLVAFNAAMARETEGRQLDPGVLGAGVRRAVDEAERGVYFVAERDGRIVGQLLVTREWSDWRCAWFWWIQSVYVTPAQRRRGAYRALHEHVVAEARRAGDVCGVRLYVDADNAAAQRVYERLGMRRTEYLVFEVDWSATPGRAASAATPPRVHPHA